MKRDCAFYVADKTMRDTFEGWSAFRDAMNQAPATYGHAEFLWPRRIVVSAAQGLGSVIAGVVTAPFRGAAWLGARYRARTQTPLAHVERVVVAAAAGHHPAHACELRWIEPPDSAQELMHVLDVSAVRHYVQRFGCERPLLQRAGALTVRRVPDSANAR